MINDKAISPVIDVALMVAITVILAAVIAAFVFGMAGQIQKTPAVTSTITKNITLESSRINDSFFWLTSNQVFTLIDSDGYGYCSPYLGIDYTVGNTYKISYYCDQNGDRQIVSATQILPPDPLKCQVINGTCQ